MLIGQDYPKIEFEFMGLQLLEPNAFIGDLMIFVVSMILYVSVRKLQKNSSFFKDWQRFYLIFGIGFLMGGFGHMMYNYWGMWGRYLPWLLGIVATYFVERAMISIHPNKERQPLFLMISQLKLIIALVAEILIFSLNDLDANQQLGLTVPTLNSVIGLGITLGGFGYYYSRHIHASFNFLWWSTLILIPSAFFQGLKINLHQWMDRSDVSHLLLIVSALFYYQTLKRYSKVA